MIWVLGDICEKRMNPVLENRDVNEKGRAIQDEWFLQSWFNDIRDIFTGYLRHECMEYMSKIYGEFADTFRHDSFVRKACGIAAVSLIYWLYHKCTSNATKFLFCCVKFIQDKWIQLAGFFRSLIRRFRRRGKYSRDD